MSRAADTTSPGVVTARSRGPASTAVRPMSKRSGTEVLEPRTPARRVRVVEKFTGRRVRQRTGIWRRLRSFVGLLLIAIIVAFALAAGIAALVETIAVAIQHALSTN